MAGTDTVSYRSSPSSVTVTINGDAFKGDAAGDMLSGFENIIGSAYDDILTGDDSNNTIEGLAGADTLDGGGGTDTLSYESSNAGVTIDLERGTGDFDETNNTIKTSSGGHATGDKVKLGSFVHIIGSAHRDTLTGDNNDNTLKGGGGNDTLNGDDGNDTLDGGPGSDTLDGGDGDTDTATYADATAAVTIDLSGSTGRGTAGDARGDTFKNIELYVGSAHDDTFIAGGNPDNFNGGRGSDTVSYERSRKAVQVDLTDANEQDATGDFDDDDNYAKGDTLTDIENIIGSNVSSGNTSDMYDELTGDGNDNVIDGRSGNDTLGGGAGDDTLIGGRGNDRLTGGNDADTFKFASGDGADTITDFNSGEGDQIDLTAYRSLAYITTDADNNNVIDLPGSRDQITLNVTVDSLTEADIIFYNRDADNTLNGDNNNNRIWGGKGEDRIDGRGGDDTLTGGPGNDMLFGGNDDDDLNGGEGDDTLEGGAGADTMDGGDGIDTLSYAGSPQRSGDRAAEDYISGVTVELNAAVSGPGTHAEVTDDQDNTTFDTISNFENLTGSRYDDMLTGSVSANVIKGGSGDDILDGNGGADTLEGGPGADTFTGNNQDDFLSYEGSSSGVRVDLSEGSETDGVIYIKTVSGGDASGDEVTYGQFLNIIGSRGSDTLTGDDASNNNDSNTLEGRGGNDTLTGNGGNDILKGGEGRDTLKGGVGGDMLDGGPGADTLDGGGTELVPGGDTATYASATESVTVDLSGGNRGRGDAAGDSYTGIEQYVGSDHADVFISGKDGDDIDGSGGSDTVSYERSVKGVQVNLSSATQTPSGDFDNADNYANGDTLNNIQNVIGSNHADQLTAHGNGSVINGGRGDDRLTGNNGGSDTFKFASGDGDDEVFSFDTNADKIDLSAFSSIASMDDLDISTVGTSNENTEIDLPGNGEITIYGVDEDNPLTADNFIFHDRPINGTSSSNVLEGDLYNNTMDGEGGDDRMFGEAGRDTLNGGSGDDEMYGGEDKDILNGGEGDDLMDGGAGADTFVFEPGNGNDYIMDFTSDADKIDLSAFDDITSGNISDIITDDGDNAVINLSNLGGGTITLLGVNENDLNTTDDFTFIS